MREEGLNVILCSVKANMCRQADVNEVEDECGKL